MQTFIDISVKEGKTHASIAQYSSKVGQFARWLGRDILTATMNDLDTWAAEGNEFKRNHITAFYKTFLTNDVANFRDRIDRDLLLYLVIH
jgi:hypothetical protein